MKKVELPSLVKTSYKCNGKKLKKESLYYKLNNIFNVFN